MRARTLLWILDPELAGWLEDADVQGLIRWSPRREDDYRAIIGRNWLWALNFIG